MRFYPVDDLRDTEIFLHLDRTCGARPERQWVPAYYFSICLMDGTKIGTCDLRIGHNDKTYIGGNIGYAVDAPYRGHHYAARACALLFRQAAKHHMQYLIISCDPSNPASARTCELAGGQYLETRDIPQGHEMYLQGKRQVRIYRFLPDPSLMGTHIVLRRAQEKDWPSMLRHIWSDEAVYQRMLYPPTFSEEDARDRCRRTIAFQKEHFSYWAALKDTDEAIGYCALKEPEPGHFEESGIAIGQAYWGRGFGKEILALLLDLAFVQLGAEDFRYSCFQENTVSAKLAEHFGFRYESSCSLTRPWDGAEKTIRSFILTREAYFAPAKPDTGNEKGTIPCR